MNVSRLWLGSKNFSLVPPLRIVQITSYIPPLPARLFHPCNHENHLGVRRLLSFSHRRIEAVILADAWLLDAAWEEVLKIHFGLFPLACLLVGVGHTVVHKDVHMFSVVGIDFVLVELVDLRIALADVLDKQAPTRRNLGKVDTLVRMGFGIVDFSSMDVVDVVEVGMVHVVVGTRHSV